MPLSRVSRPRRLRTGFTLVETVVAIAIISLISMATISLLQRVSTNLTQTNHQNTALRIARNEVEVLRASGYGTLPASGSFTDSMLSSLPSGSASLTVTDVDPKIKRVTVTVSWVEAGSGASTRSVSLVTLISQNSLLK